MLDKDIETDNFDSFDIPENEVSLGELGIEKNDADYISFNLAGTSIKGEREEVNTRCFQKDERRLQI